MVIAYINDILSIAGADTVCELEIFTDIKIVHESSIHGENQNAHYLRFKNNNPRIPINANTTWRFQQA